MYCAELSSTIFHAEVLNMTLITTVYFSFISLLFFERSFLSHYSLNVLSKPIKFLSARRTVLNYLDSCDAYVYLEIGARDPT